MQAALRSLHASTEALDQLRDLRLTSEGVRERAAYVARTHAAAEKKLLQALIVLQSMTDNSPVELSAIFGPDSGE